MIGITAGFFRYQLVFNIKFCDVINNREMLQIFHMFNQCELLDFKRMIPRIEFIINHGAC